LQTDHGDAKPVTQTLSEHKEKARKCRQSKALNGPANTTLAAET
jgi:hypothetical protein